MNSLKLLSFSCLLAALSFGQAPGYTITTFAGAGGTGNTGNSGPAIAATLNIPTVMARDSAGKIYIADTLNYYIRAIGTDGNIVLFAGAGVRGLSGDGGVATVAQIGSVFGIAVDKAGNVYFSDALDSAIRKVTTDGKISTIGGNQSFGFGGDGEVATGVNAFLAQPTGLALDANGNVYFCDTLNNRIRKINAADQILSTVVGGGDANYGGDGGPAIDAKLNGPLGISFDSLGNMYIADTGNHRIRKVTLDGNITTVAGNGDNAFTGEGGLATSASLNYPKSVVVDGSGNIFIGDTVNNRIRQVTENGKIYTIAGNGLFGDYNGNNDLALDAQLMFPWGLMLDGAGGLFIADTDNSKIKRLTPIPQAPKVSNGGVISSSAFGAFGAAAPGTWIEIYGSSLASLTRSWTASDFTGDVAPRALSGTSVTIGGKSAYVAFVSPTQVNVQVPDGVPAGNQDVIVTTQQVDSGPVSVQVNATQPGLYAPPQFQISGKQYVGAILSDSSFSLPVNAVSGVTSRPVHPGETITLYGIGFGPVAPLAHDGQVVRAADAVVLPLEVMFGSTHAQVASAGLVAGSMGLYQFNVVVPAVAASSAVPLTFKLNDVAGQQSLYIAISQ
ncbi:MAG: IPT/TIG domain-containing protein [Acidobacteriota bacterium]